MISFKHNDYSWEVARSYKDIKDTHKMLSKLVKADIGRSCSDISKDDIKPDWPLFPNDHDHSAPQAPLEKRCKHLAEYLERLLTYPPFRDHTSVLHLIGVSPLSFIIGLSPSVIEDSIQKRSGDNIYYGRLSQLKVCCENIKIFHTKRWFALKDTYLVYLNEEENNKLGYVMLLDREFDCKQKIRAGAYHALVIKNLQRTFVLKCRNGQQQKDWYEKIHQVMASEAGKRFNHVDLLPNGSYAPCRPNQRCKWYINARMYMEHVMLALNNAKEEIFITDWWLCPELFLKRPTDDLQYRLDKILLKKAREGVKVYVLLFKELEMAIGLCSSRAKSVITQNGKNPNIKVLRHPEHTPSGVFLWSHHEKCVIIDQSVAFAGGIDLCFGRWDDDLHRLIDLGRRENVTDIDTTKIVKESAMIDLANEIQVLI
jgi:phospholipase D1/2